MHRHALVTGPDPSLLLCFRAALGQIGYLVETIALDRVPSQPFAVAIVDARQSARSEGRHRLGTLARRGLLCAVVLPGAEQAALDAGADEAITDTKPDAERLRSLIKGAAARLGRAVDGPLGRIIGRSPTLLQVLARIETYADSSATVLITGETGTGKELVARGIHLLSARQSGPFVPINCAAIPESLVESEIFGHARGAFTGATSAHPGRIAVADGGTLFLDEVNELTPAAQAKLLRVLQEREYTPVGSSMARKANVRIVAATNRKLESDVEQGRFRADLYWRLEVITVELPPLRQRAGDVMPLVYHFIDRTNHLHRRQVTAIEPAAQEMLVGHDWPGNVRELENTIERGVILRGEGWLREEDIILRRPRTPGSMLDHVRLPPDGLDLQEVTGALELLLIDQALEQTGGNRTQAARLLHINRTTLLEKMRRRGVGGQR